MVHALNKGKQGEREAAKWLHSKFKLESMPYRNLEQTRSGGFDLLGFEPFAFEIKRCETLSLRSWWRQVVNSLTVDNNLPVVMYRQNRGKWRFLISATYIGCKNGYIMIEEREFLMFANRVISGK